MKERIKGFVYLLILCVVNANIIPQKRDLNCDLSEELVREIESYQAVADRIIEYVIEGEFKGKTYNE